MDNLLKLRNMLDNFLYDVNDDLGGEKIQPYVIIMQGILKAINTELKSD